MAFIGGQLDLRDAYLHPEVDNALYLIEAKQENLAATTLLQPNEITEEMLPEAGYFFDPEDGMASILPSQGHKKSSCIINMLR